jgi:hypothetical protein
MRATSLVAAALAVVCAAPTVRAGGAPLVIPQVAAAPTLDGELDELAWRTPARTGPFTDAAGAMAAPYSEARFLRDARNLYFALYAADENIVSTDEFVIELASARGHRTLRYSAAGKLRPQVSGARAAVDLDGSVDDPSNDDEEWVVEGALPLTAVPFARDGTVRITITRCDVTKDSVQRCGTWRGTLARR